MSQTYARWPGGAYNAPTTTIKVRKDDYGALHVDFPGGIYISAGAQHAEAFAVELGRVARQAAAHVDVDDADLRALAAAIIAEQEGLRADQVLRIVGAFANYLAHPPTDAERELLADGIEVAS